MRIKYGWLAVLLVGCKLSATGSLLGSSSMSRAPSAPSGPASSGSGDELVRVPDLFLMTQAEAEAAIARAGFQRGFGFETSMCGSAVDGKVVELGRVCYQSPAAGQRTSPRVPVRIRVQRESPWRGELGNGRFWFLMPDLRGLPVEEAKARLRALGFTSKEVKIGYADSYQCAPGTVCKTVPEGLTRADSTSDKLFYVGGPPPKPEAPKPTATAADSAR